MGKVITKDADGFERIVFGEVIIPDVPNVYGDFHTKESVREFAYGFMMNGFGIDLHHDNNDVTGKVKVLESFIARPGDPDFIEGSWVVGVHIPDDDTWQMVLDSELNGFSYEAFIYVVNTVIDVPDDIIYSGTTEPHKFDGHTHQFFVVLDESGRPVLGGTSYSQGHMHPITHHTFTDTAFEHSHIYNFVVGSGGK